MKLLEFHASAQQGEESGFTDSKPKRAISTKKAPALKARAFR